jgi:hypothetical protein
MQKLLTLLSSVSVMALLTIGFSSCKDDEKEPSTATLEFSTAAKTVAEGEQSVKANIVLDNPAPVDVIVEYDISGSATRKIGSAANGDYEIVGTVGEVEIAKGATSAEIEINILSDNSLESEEKIVLEIVDVSSSQVLIGTDDLMEITIEGGGSVVASFASTALTVNESDAGIHELTVNLSSAAAFDVTVEYDLKAWLDGSGKYIPGTAIDSLSAFNQVPPLPSDYYDYFIDGTSGQLVIPAGQTTGVIKVNVLSDFLWEDPESFDITLKNSSGVTVEDATKKMTITIEQENGQAVVLSWPAAANADMDLFLWLSIDDEGTPVNIPIAYSINAGMEGPEVRFIPQVFSEEIKSETGVTAVNYGASYVYYEGGTGALEFQVDFVNFADGTDAIIKTSKATYTAVNKNEWDTETGTDPIIVQTFDYTSGAIANISDITVPTAGSRVRAVSIGKVLKRMNMPLASRSID